MTSTKHIPFFITIHHARAMLGWVSRDTIYRLMRQRKLKFWRIGRIRVITIESLRSVARERGIVL